MTHSKSQIGAIALTLLAAGCMASCGVNKDASQMIPSVNETDIEKAVETLGVSADDFTTFLDTIGVTYDDYIANLNKRNKSLDDVKKNIEEMYDCTFSEYIETITTVTNKTIPDSKDYGVFTSKYSIYNVYIPAKELDSNKSSLTNYGIKIEIADNSRDAYAFDSIADCGGDFKTYIDILNRLYNCSSVEFTNISLYGGHGVTKPDKANACMDNLFVYDDKTNEVLEVIIVPVMTLRNEDENKNITLALSNELGLIFRAEGADSYEKMLKISELDFQIRSAGLSGSETKSTDN